MIKTSDGNVQAEVSVDVSGSMKVEADGTITLLGADGGEVTITSANNRTKIELFNGRISEGGEDGPISSNAVRSLAASPRYFFIIVGEGDAKITDYPDTSDEYETVLEGTVIRINSDGTIKIMGDPDPQTRGGSGGGCGTAGALILISALSVLSARRSARGSKKRK